MFPVYLLYFAINDSCMLDMHTGWFDICTHTTKWFEIYFLETVHEKLVK